MRKALILVAIGLAAVPPGETRAASVDVPPEILRQYRVEYDATTGYVVGLDDAEAAARWRSCSGTRPADQPSVDAALDFLWAHSSLFGLRAGVDELVYRTSYSCARWSWVTFEQRCRGVQVPGAYVLMRLDTEHRVEFVGGMFMPGLNIDLAPSLSADEARVIAARAVEGGDAGKTRVGELLLRRRPERAAAIITPDPRGQGFEDSGAGDYLAWWTYPHSSDGTNWVVIVDAHTGKVLAKHVRIEGCIR
jgi:hypothetical protein